MQPYFSCQRRGLLAAGAAALGDGREALYELSVGNPDKGMLELDVVRRRVAQFTDAGLPVVVTQVPAKVPHVTGVGTHPHKGRVQFLSSALLQAAATAADTCVSV